MKKGRKRALFWAAGAAALVLFYYLGTGAWSYLTLRRQRAEAERRLLHLRARTLALEARKRRLEDPGFAKKVLEARLGVNLEGPREGRPDSSAPRPGADAQSPAP